MDIIGYPIIGHLIIGYLSNYVFIIGYQKLLFSIQSSQFFPKKRDLLVKNPNSEESQDPLHGRQVGTWWGSAPIFWTPRFDINHPGWALKLMGNLMENHG